MPRIAIVEKANHNAVHAYCSTLESAQRYLAEIVPLHCARGYYMDKTLTPDSFEITTKA